MNIQALVICLAVIATVASGLRYKGSRSYKKVPSVHKNRVNTVVLLDRGSVISSSLNLRHHNHGRHGRDVVAVVSQKTHKGGVQTLVGGKKDLMGGKKEGKLRGRKGGKIGGKKERKNDGKKGRKLGERRNSGWKSRKNGH